MSTLTKPKAIHYKNVFITGDANLQLLLKGALSATGNASRPSLRQQKANDEDTSVVFINKFKEYNGMSFGQLVYLESGKQQPFITVDDDAEFYSISSLSSEKIPEIDDKEKTEAEAAKKRREFLESMLYFGVLDNHMVVMQSSALKTRELEAHLSWLLGTKTSQIDQSTMLVLKDKPAEAVYSKMERKPVKSIHVGAPLTSKIENDPSAAKTEPRPVKDIEETHASKVRYTPQGLAASLLKVVAPGLLDRLELDESLDESNLKVALEITYLRKTTRAGQQVIDSLATSLRHNPESDVVINLQGGGKIRGDELKLSGNITVKFLDSGLIDEGVLFHEMHQWLISKISASEVDSNLDGSE